MKPFSDIFHAWQYDPVLDLWMRPPTLKDFQELTNRTLFFHYKHIGQKLIYPSVSVWWIIWRIIVRKDNSLKNKLSALFVWGAVEDSENKPRMIQRPTDVELLSKLEQLQVASPFTLLLANGYTVDLIMNMTPHQMEAISKEIVYNQTSMHPNITADALKKIDNPFMRSPKKASFENGKS